MPTGKVLLIIGASLLGLCLVGSVIGVATGGSSTPATSDAASTPTPAATTASPFAAWYADGGNDHLQALVSDFTRVGTAGKTLDRPAMRDACASLQKDVESAQAYRPFPDSEGQKWWAAALAASARSATDCVASIDTTSTQLMLRANEEIQNANDAMVKLAARKKELGV